MRKAQKRAKIFTTAVIKGGTGKTTTAAALAQAAAADGKKVLAIDLDPQGNLTMFLGAQQTRAGSYDLLHGVDPSRCVQSTAQGIDTAAASADLATEKTAAMSAKRLRDALEKLRGDYDFIMIDTPPQIGEVTFNALNAADGLLIPLEADNGSLQGLYQIADISERMKQSNPELTIAAVIVTRYDARPKLNRYLHDIIAEKGRELGAQRTAEIRPGIAIREAQSMRESLFEYAPKSNPAQDYQKLYKSLAED